MEINNAITIAANVNRILVRGESDWGGSWLEHGMLKKLILSSA